MSSFVINPDHPSLPGHFPGRPLVPGVVLLDHVCDAIEAGQAGLALRALRLPQVKFMQPLRPGETARIELERIEGETPRWRFRVLRDAVVLASGEVVAAAVVDDCVADPASVDRAAATGTAA